MDDRELIAAYVRERSEEAFATLVKRYMDLVYSSALRQIGEPELARDVTQAVFLILARKASSLPSQTILSGWLYRTARFVSMEARRREKRRKERESSMALERDYSDTAEDIWSRIAPNLDELMERLREADRTVIVLRFFQEKSFDEIAATLGVNEEAARKRVNRALDRLRQSLARRGITGSSSILSAALAAYAVQPTPAAIAAAIPAVAHGATTLFSAQLLTQGALQMIKWTKIKTAAACVTVLLLATGTAVVDLRYSKARSEHAQLVQARTQFQNEQEKAARQASEELARLEAENARLATEAQQIHRLRARVADLQRQKRETAQLSDPKALQNAPLQIQAAAERLRELQFERFVVAGQNALKLQPPSAEQRDRYARSINLVKNIGLALHTYSMANDDQFPPSLDQLLEKNLISQKIKEDFVAGGYEYNRFTNAESKPSLPAVWSGAPDTNGIRVIVLNDMSAHLIREPVGVEIPGSVSGSSHP